MGKDKSTSDNNQGTKFEIPVEGSLGLLALGAVGLRAWRKVRKEANQQQQSENDNKQ